jgi:hypothetical protein
MTTQTIEIPMKNKNDLATYSLEPTFEEFYDENQLSFMNWQRIAQMSQKPIMLPQITIINGYKIKNPYEMGDFIGRILRLRSLACDVADDFDIAEPITLTIEAQEYLPKYNDSNVVLSSQVAAKLRAEKMSAFTPVSAAELIWLEAQSMDNDVDE